MTNTAKLVDRGVIKISGTEALGFLQGLVTCDMDKVLSKNPGFGSLLSPQGKILFDFFIHADGDAFLIDCRADMVVDFIKRLTFYKLRAQVEIEDISTTHVVIGIWGDETKTPEGFVQDPRLASLGWRGIFASATTPTESASLVDYHAHRIALGVPEGGLDFEFGNTFPHDADMDQLNGVSFSKGCYVGQEVVSRMENRGTARTRMLKVTSKQVLPSAGIKIEAGGKPVGTLGTSANGNAIATVRLDRMEKAHANGDAITADTVPLELIIQDWADFSTANTDTIE